MFMTQKTLYQGKILKLLILDNKWEVIEHQEAVAVLALQAGKVLGVRQFRPAIGQETWEIPAGLIDQGETPLAAAKRELAEETQLTGKLELISQFYSSPGFCNEKIYLYLASDLSAMSAQGDDDEVLKVSWDDPFDLWQAIKGGQLASSGPSLLALQYAIGILL
jgi:ADP-ribose pyrophosphatase